MMPLVDARIDVDAKSDFGVARATLEEISAALVRDVKDANAVVMVVYLRKNDYSSNSIFLSVFRKRRGLSNTKSPRVIGYLFFPYFLIFSDSYA